MNVCNYQLRSTFSKKEKIENINKSMKIILHFLPTRESESC